MLLVCELKVVEGAVLFVVWTVVVVVVVITVPMVVISLLLQPSYHPATPFSSLYIRLQWVQLASFISCLVQ